MSQKLRTGNYIQPWNILVDVTYTSSGLLRVAFMYMHFITGPNGMKDEKEGIVYFPKALAIYLGMFYCK